MHVLAQTLTPLLNVKAFAVRTQERCYPQWLLQRYQVSVMLGGSHPPRGRVTRVGMSSTSTSIWVCTLCKCCILEPFMPQRFVGRQRLVKLVR